MKISGFNKKEDFFNEVKRIGSLSKEQLDKEKVRQQEVATNILVGSSLFTIEEINRLEQETGIDSRKLGFIFNEVFSELSVFDIIKLKTKSVYFKDMINAYRDRIKELEDEIKENENTILELKDNAEFYQHVLNQQDRDK